MFEHGSSTGYGGDGVGLTIVGRIAQAHGWSVELTEGPEGGARFAPTAGEAVPTGGGHNRPAGDW